MPFPHVFFWARVLMSESSNHACYQGIFTFFWTYVSMLQCVLLKAVLGGRPVSWWWPRYKHKWNQMQLIVTVTISLRFDSNEKCLVLSSSQFTLLSNDGERQWESVTCAVHAPTAQQYLDWGVAHPAYCYSTSVLSARHIVDQGAYNRFWIVVVLASRISGATAQVERWNRDVQDTNNLIKKISRRPGCWHLHLASFVCNDQGIYVDFGTVYVKHRLLISGVPVVCKVRHHPCVGHPYLSWTPCSRSLNSVWNAIVAINSVHGFSVSISWSWVLSYRRLKHNKGRSSEIYRQQQRQTVSVWRHDLSHWSTTW